MRITGGEFRGRIVRTVDDLSVRPATDRVRQTLFNMLVNRLDFDGLRVLDLYAGSGSLGIEALSRGAAHAVFVEGNHHAMELLEHNLAQLGCTERTEVFSMDAVRYLKQAGSKFGLVFADPPYAYPETASLPVLAFSHGIVEPEGYLLIEHSTDLTFEDSPLYNIGPVKKFGRTVVTFFTGKESNETAHSDLSGHV
jgi:16S rRNA (guanine966-N2)-methyltransferase